MVNKQNTLKKDACRQMYSSGQTDNNELALLFDVSPRTIRNWIKSGGWKTVAETSAGINDEIKRNIKLALLNSLEQYTQDPVNVPL